MVVAGVMAASLMQTLDTTITNVALPNIQGNLGASQDEGTWIVTAYTIAAIVIIPITPWLQNRFGRKNYYVASIVGFTLASLMCGRSGQLFELVSGAACKACSGADCLRPANRFCAIRSRQ
jgi:DHA2 family multidrug resistance protein